jgi:hypothetical protein
MSTVPQQSVIDANPDTLAKLLDVQLRWEANEARKAFHAAFQLFKATAPTILKTHEVKYTNKDGSVTKYTHAELDKITETIGDALKAVGITHTWRSSDANGRTTVTCVLTYSDTERGLAHSEDVSTLSGPADTSGGKNSVQAVGSTSTYLCRYTLLMGCGLAPQRGDDDGRKSEGMPERAIEEHLMAIRDSASIDELKQRYMEAKQAANAAADNDAIKQFVAAKDERYRKLRTA